MKIFNWVQRRFHHGSIKEGLVQSVKKAEFVTNGAEKQALLKQVALVDVLEGWKDGILTIVTSGFDPLKNITTRQKEYFTLESDEEEDVEEEEEENEDPKDGKGQLNVHVDGDNDTVEDEELKPLILTTFENKYDDAGHNSFTNSRLNSAYYEIDQRRKKGERTTLAELFQADSEMIKKKPEFIETELNPGKKPVDRTKNGLSFAKKVLPHVREDLRPKKRIHQLMRKMLKRKIHPDLQGKLFEVDNQNKPGSVENQAINEETSESVSLLQTGQGLAI
ncbi:hypothetical protein K2173_003448 [Erythroxylum novogranatense]|uniref:Protein TILLER ANGLE CONTROL 1 n=1 Tax=Erythroxylum novogranatense TaxID=1862640 RepID=A0AAV8S8V1_9ROSI|nr:hypothetical protein K2173_003448 [Erythroxylum novogranatense]